MLSEDKRKTRQLTVLLIVFGAFSFIGFVMAIVASFDLALGVMLGLLCATLVASAVLLHRRMIRAASWVFLSAWAGLVIASLAMPSVEGITFLLMPYFLVPVPIVAAMLFKPWSSFVALAMSVALYAVVFFVRGSALDLAMPDAAVRASAYLVWALFGGLAVSTLSWLFARDMNQALVQAQESHNAVETQLEATAVIITEIVVAATRAAGLADDLTTTMAYIAGGAEEIAQTTGRMAVGAGEQATQVEQVSRSAARLAEATRQIAARSNEVRDASTESERLVNGTVQMIGTLRHRLEAVDQIVRMVDKIADQTNLLALNAAIEAARAGEAGAGFAVVAEEVQRLAERSAASVDQIGVIVAEVRASLQPVLDSVAAVQAGTQLSHAMAQRTAALTVEQEQESDAMVGAVSSIAVVAEHNAVATEEIAASVEQQLASIEQVALSTQRLSTVASDLRAVIAGHVSEVGSLCPNLNPCPIFSDLFGDSTDQALVRRYCMGKFDDCARKQLKDAGNVVPPGLMPDGTVRAQLQV